MMSHLSENSRRLEIQEQAIHTLANLQSELRIASDVVLLRLKAHPDKTPLSKLDELAKIVRLSVHQSATLIVVGEVIDLVHLHAALAPNLRYHLWIAMKRATTRVSANASALPEQHFGALVYTSNATSFEHSKTRIEYTYCPACDKTTKDYGGKKHTYHEYGTLISDVWRDIACDLEGDLTPMIERFADLFGVEKYSQLQILDLQTFGADTALPTAQTNVSDAAVNALLSRLNNALILGDCLEELRKFPDNSVDFAFADPPYNLRKNYTGYSDDLAISEYFEWCDEWLSELARVLRPGQTCAILNIPLWAVRHFLHLESVLEFQNWIGWDALSFPVRLIMPAHYTILCFTKGTARPLPGLIGEAGITEPSFVAQPFKSLNPLAGGYCLRQNCVQTRSKKKVNDRGVLTDLWGDIHRLKHNSRRVDHPCQLPPQLMYRLISIFTKPGEVVLDCFNGAGTTTLAAHQLGRSYIGIEAVPKYHKVAQERHAEVNAGIDPFRKEERELTAKNSPVARLPKQKYEVPKKTLQLEVKRVAQLIDRLPSREDMIEYGKYPIRYYDEYFSSWGEVCAAARTTGMSETREPLTENRKSSQPRLF